MVSLHRLGPVRLALALSGCAGEPADEPAIGTSAAALTPVSWTDVVGVSATVGNLTKTASETAWNAGAVSVQTLAGDGYVEFTTGETTTDKAIGLSAGNSNAKMSDIDFCVRLKPNGAAMVYESGVALVSIGSYTPGVVFRVQAEDGVVTYWRNGVLKYTSAIAPTFPLLVDTSLRTPGATLTDVRIEPMDFWIAAVGVTVSGRDITKTAPEDLFNAGAVSLDSIPSGDGFVEFRVADTTTTKAAGLSHGNSNQSRTDIDFAISLGDDGGIALYEGGVTRGGFGPYHVGDVFRVEVAGGVVRYLVNRVPFYTSTLAPTYPLLFDVSLRTPGTSLLDAKLVAGYVTDECVPLVDTLPAPGAYVGAVATGGDLMVVGQRYATPPVATVYRLIDGEWIFEQTLSNPDPTRGFAGRVATDGETIAVGIGGLQGEDGSVQVYRQDTGGAWVEDIRIEQCPGGQYGLFDFAVRGDLLIAAETFDDRVHVYRRVDGAWGLEALLTPIGGESSQYFGSDLAIGGDRVFVLASLDDPGGSAYVFRYIPGAPEPSEPPSCSFIDPGKWQQKSRLVTSDGQVWRGIDADPSGRRMLIGNWRNGALLFEVSGGVWNQTNLFIPYPDESVSSSVALGGPGGDSVAIVGAGIFAELADGWAQIGLASADAIGTDWLFRRVSDAVQAYRLEPVCLVE
jgi:hypothetical protein